MRTQLNQISSSDSAPESAEHKAVLLHEAVSILGLQEGDCAFDATVGHAGHSSEIAKIIKDSGTLVGTDLSADALEIARKKLSFFKGRLCLKQASFAQIDEVLQSCKAPKPNAILADLGWNTGQLHSGLGFSFNSDEPLIMRYDQKKQDEDLTAYDVVNLWSKDALADIIYGFGGERFARKIADAIVKARENQPIQTARQLAQIITKAIPPKYRSKKIHPATKTFQAIRIAVNDELGELERFLQKIPQVATQKTTIAIITFHSIEDRVVKKFFKLWQMQGLGKTLTQKPILPTKQEIAENKKARSAKLRAFKFGI